MDSGKDKSKTLLIEANKYYLSTIWIVIGCY